MTRTPTIPLSVYVLTLDVSDESAWASVYLTEDEALQQAVASAREYLSRRTADLPGLAEGAGWTTPRSLAALTDAEVLALTSENDCADFSHTIEVVMLPVPVATLAAALAARSGHVAL